jgi:hypothetical protein
MKPVDKGNLVNPMNKSALFGIFALAASAAACAAPTDADVAAKSADAIRAQGFPPAGDGTVLVFEPRLRGCWLADGRLRQTLSFSFGEDAAADGFSNPGDRYVSTSSFDGDEASAAAGTFSTRTARSGFTVILDQEGEFANTTSYEANFVDDDTLTLHQRRPLTAPGGAVSNIAFPTITYLRQSDDAVCLPPAHRGDDASN